MLDFDYVNTLLYIFRSYRRDLIERAVVATTFVIAQTTFYSISMRKANEACGNELN